MNGDRSVARLVKEGKKKNKRDDPLKVVYISSPMKVKTSASRFRSLVQQLTGKNSDISQYMDDSVNNGAGEFYHEIDCQDQSLVKETRSSVSADDTPSSSDSLSFPGAMDINVFTSQMREQFEGIFSSNSFYDPSQMDVLGSFDELI